MIPVEYTFLYPVKANISALSLHFVEYPIPVSSFIYSTVLLFSVAYWFSSIFLVLQQQQLRLLFLLVPYISLVYWILKPWASCRSCTEVCSSLLHLRLLQVLICSIPLVLSLTSSVPEMGVQYQDWCVSLGIFSNKLKEILSNIMYLTSDLVMFSFSCISFASSLNFIIFSLSSQIDHIAKFFITIRMSSTYYLRM